MKNEFILKLSKAMEYKLIVIGGSAGSFHTVLDLLSKIPKNYSHTIIFCLHRLKSVRKGFVEALNAKSSKTVIEPNDKDLIEPGNIYLSPSNYHLFVNNDHSFSLSTEDVVNHSRPSIDFAFSSAGSVFRENSVGILLSGANRDGSAGLKSMEDSGSMIIIQNPTDCQVDTMPNFAIESTSKYILLNSCEIV
ncbi:MAG: chemotaxis protein CheB, partial [Bacteroidota bacterium]